MTLSDTVSGIAALTAAQIQGFATDGITALYAADATSGIPASISVAAAVALEAASMKITVPVGATVWLSNSSADMATPTTTQIAMLPSIGVSEIYDFGEVLSFTLAQFQAIQTAGLAAYDESGIAVQVTPDQLLGLTATDITALISAGVSGLAVTGAVSLTLAEAQSFSGLYLSAPPGDAVAVSGSAGAIEAFTAAQIQTIAYVGVTAITASGSLSLSATTVSTLEEFGITLSVPAGDTVTLADTASDITQNLANGIFNFAGLPALGIGAITATGGPLGLSVTNIQTLEFTRHSRHRAGLHGVCLGQCIRH